MNRSLSIICLAPYQVVQREGVRLPEHHANTPNPSARGWAEVPLRGRYTGDPSAASFEASTAMIGAGVGQAVPWTPLSVAWRGDGEFEATLTVPAGGWYLLIVRAREVDGPVATVQVGPFGVGEVYLIAGQSHADNASDARLSIEDPDGRVTAYHLAGDFWRIANDPQPTPEIAVDDRTQWATAAGHAGRGRIFAPGSIWPPAMNLLQQVLGVPIGMVNVASPGAIADWLQPDGVLFQRLLAGAKYARRFRAVLWQHGESDVLADTAADKYIAAFDSLRDALAQGIDWRPDWLVAKSTHHPTCYSKPDQETALRKAVSTLCAQRPDVFEGPDTDLLGGNSRSPRDRSAHFTKAGQKLAGALWFRSLMNHLVARGESQRFGARPAATSTPPRTPDLRPFSELVRSLDTGRPGDWHALIDAAVEGGLFILGREICEHVLRTWPGDEDAAATLAALTAPLSLGTRFDQFGKELLGPFPGDAAAQDALAAAIDPLVGAMHRLQADRSSGAIEALQQAFRDTPFRALGDAIGGRTFLDGSEIRTRPGALADPELRTSTDRIETLTGYVHWTLSQAYASLPNEDRSLEELGEALRCHPELGVRAHDRRELEWVDQPADSITAPGGAGIVLFTFVPPSRLATESEITQQKRCIQSWRLHGFDVRTVSPRGESGDIRRVYPEIDVVEAGREGKVHLSDLFVAMSGNFGGPSGIIHPATLLKPEPRLPGHLRQTLDGASLVLATTVELPVNRASAPAEDAISYSLLFLPRGLLAALDDPGITVESAGWDLWLALKLIALGARPKPIRAPIAARPAAARSPDPNDTEKCFVATQRLLREAGVSPAYPNGAFIAEQLLAARLDFACRHGRAAERKPADRPFTRRFVRWLTECSSLATPTDTFSPMGAR